jgi:hypothetical protein
MKLTTLLIYLNLECLIHDQRVLNRSTKPKIANKLIFTNQLIFQWFYKENSISLNEYFLPKNLFCNRMIV